MWEAKEYTITYVLNGWTNNENNPSSYTIESWAITILDPSREWYTFEGWTEWDSIPAWSTWNRTFTATWDEIEYDIHYNLNGWTNHADNPATYTINDYVVLKSPSREWYTFQGWTEWNIIPTGSTWDKTFTATWEAKEYTITYVLSWWTNSTNNPDVYTIESDTIVLESPSKVGYAFSGWLEWDRIMHWSTGNKTFTADWTANIDTPYTVNHYQESLSWIWVLVETEFLEWETDTLVTPSTKTYEWFTSPSTETKKVDALGITRFDYKFYNDQNVIELKQALNSYYAMANEYPKEVLEILKSEGFDYQDFSNGVLKEAQTFIYKYDLKFKEEEKTAKI